MAKPTRKSQQSRLAKLKFYVADHKKNSSGALKRLLRQPSNSFLTVLVMGIALALPSMFYLAVDNLQTLTGGWVESVTMSVYLKDERLGEDSDRLRAELEQHALVKQLTYLSKDQALEEFRERSGLSEMIDLLEENPLPATMIIVPTTNELSALKPLAAELRDHRAVDDVSLDSAWIERLRAILALLQRGIWILALLFAIAIFVIVGNAVRLEVQSRRQEIEVSRLVGASLAFTRRPFLYSGLWYGLLGGMAAIAIIVFVQWLITGPITALSASYGGVFQMRRLDLALSAELVGFSILVCLVSAWFAAQAEIKRLEIS